MNKVIDKGFRSCRFVSTIVKHPVSFAIILHSNLQTVGTATSLQIPFAHSKFLAARRKCATAFLHTPDVN